MKERVELEITTMESAIESLGYLHIDEAKSRQLIEFFKELYAENQVLKADRWLPIASAPKDGEPIITIVAGYKPTVAWYELGRWKNTLGGVAEAAFSKEDYLSFPENKSMYQPTHWMPLPTPLEAALQSKEE